MFHSGDNIGAIVADCGSYSFRLGHAGEDSPRAYFPSAISSVPDGSSSQGGRKYQFTTPKYQPYIAMQSAISEEGLITDWDLFEKTWDFALDHYLKVNLKDLPLLMTEKPFQPTESRHKLCELMFEKYGCAAFFLAKDATLACYACGKTSGLVVDCGASGTVVSPVIDGWIEMKGVVKSAIGGRYMDDYMSQLLTTKFSMRPRPLYRLHKTVSEVGIPVVNELGIVEPIDPSWDSYTQLELARDLKETVCACAESPLQQSEAKYSQIPTVPYELPDGTIVDSSLERFLVPELFFTPTSATPIYLKNLYSASRQSSTVMPISSDNLPQLVQNALYRCELEGSLASMWSNVVLTGGNSCYRGLQERLKSELEPKAQANKVRILAASEVERSDKADKMKSVIDRAICPWLGGSIMGSLGSFHEVWISKKEYEEYGAQVVDLKCP